MKIVQNIFVRLVDGNENIRVFFLQKNTANKNYESVVDLIQFNLS